MVMDLGVVLNLTITFSFLWRGQCGVIFSITQRLILSASNKIFVNLITATSVIVVVTGNGDKGRKREVRQHMSPFLTAKKEKDGNSFLNRGQN